MSSLIAAIIPLKETEEILRFAQDDTFRFFQDCFQLVFRLPFEL